MYFAISPFVRYLIIEYVLNLSTHTPKSAELLSLPPASFYNFNVSLFFY